MEKSKDILFIENYLSALPKEYSKALSDFRKLVKKLFPNATEAINYGAPGFKYEGKSLATYAASKNHMAYYPMSPAVIEKFSKELKEFETAKGTVRFTLENPIPQELLKKMLLARVDEISSKS